jgi:6-phosphogluconate dehydrogenase
MQLGMVGLGKMGANMTTRLLRGGHQVVAYDLNPEAVAKAQAGGAQGYTDLGAFVSALDKPRAIWVMVPAGEPTEATLNALADLLDVGDTLIDGGNSNYKDSRRRAEALAQKGLHFVDVGTSGGIWGLTEGYSLMIGGAQEPVNRLRPIFETLAPSPTTGWGHVGAAGAGHFTKMVHNGIEYGLMQAYAEGFEILQAKREYGFDLPQIAEIWRVGSVVRSWLLDLTAQALAENPTLDGLAAYVPDSGEGRWTVFEAIDLDVPAPVIQLALLMRFVSRQEASFAAKLLSAMRGQFGGHAVKKAGE